MDLKGFVDRAKDAATAAADKAKAVAAAVSDQARSATATPAPLPELAPEADADTQALVPVSAAPDPGKSVALFTSEKFAELKALGTEKVQEMVTAFQQALPAIRSAGYELTEFEIELGVTPKLIPHFRYAAQNADDVGLAREALRDNKLGAMILGALLKAGDVHKQIKVAGFCFSHIEVELGLIPSIRLQYKNDKER